VRKKQFPTSLRSPQEHAEVRLPKAVLVPLGALRKRMSEIPKDKEIIAFCKVSLRGYEAALILKAAGYEAFQVPDGGVAMWLFEEEKWGRVAGQVAPSRATVR
jgi:rhodanese-related sulfurtransferase